MVIKMLSFRTVVITFFIGFVPLESFAEPVITGSVGELKVGNTIEIHGNNFGTMDGKIISWDDFEGQTTGAVINGAKSVIGGNWSTIYNYSGKGAIFDDFKSHSGSKSAHLNWSVNKHTIRAFGWRDRGPYNKLYISYQRYMEGDYKAKNKDNHKQFYLYGNKKQFPQGMPLMPAGTSVWGFYNNVGNGKISWSERNNKNTKGWKYSNTIGKFQRWEWYIQLNKPYTASNGIIRGWLDGLQGIKNESYRHTYVDGKYVDFRLGHMAQGFNDTAKAWFDDLYIATTQARVELCDKPLWMDCRNKDVQVADEVTWGNSNLSFTLNSGFLNYSEAIYLYVVDKNGVANTTGYKLIER